MSDDPFARMLGSSAAAEAARTFGRRAALVDAPVLLLGESGTGKGVLARAIHEASPRARGAFVAVNCAAVPDALFESEFFGHVRGAFTGAQYAHRGLLEQAHNGTLFLDEIGELRPVAQAKLLTAIEDRQVRRVGGERVQGVNLRLVAATASDLQRAVATGAFRRDLFHRLSVLQWSLPPLRVRCDDVHELAFYLLKSFCEQYRRACSFDLAALDLLAAHTWPGNIRELANAIEAAILTSSADSTVITEAMLANKLYAPRSGTAEEPSCGPMDEHARIVEALRQFDGNRTRAAAALGMGRTTLWLRLKRLDAEARAIEQDLNTERTS